MGKPRKLIEVALPIKEISAESVRDKSIRHGHISTLHLWWARRPLPVCRAVVFASLVPDPLDENCPKAFIEAVDQLLAKDPQTKLDPYKPYDDIPYTAIIDPMEDNSRNRLLMFIGKFSEKFILTGGKVPAKDKLNDACLIKWDNKNNNKILNIARKLIWVAHNVETNKDAQTLIIEYDQAFKAIKEAENDLFSIPDRHLKNENVTAKQNALEQTIESFLNRMPKVFDPFAGGGAIPLEVARLGCRSYGNDINPVAHIIQKGSLEFPQKYGKPITYSYEEFVKIYGKETIDKIPFTDRVIKNGEVAGIKIQNRLSFDVEFYVRKLVDFVEKEVGHYYPVNDKGNKPIAYCWTRIGTCSNPSCKAEIPLLKNFYLVNKPNKKIFLSPNIQGKEISFQIMNGKSLEEGWVINRKNLKCPICQNLTKNKELKSQFINGVIKERLLAVIEEGNNGKSYRLPSENDLKIFQNISFSGDLISEKLPVKNSKQFDTCPWGFVTYGNLFSIRQHNVLHSLVKKIESIKQELKSHSNEYGKTITTYLAILFDRFITRYSQFNIWDTGYEKVAMLFGRQAIPMTFDYVEINPFCKSGPNLISQIKWITKYIDSESGLPFFVDLSNASSGEKKQFPEKHFTAVVTDPPYYDAIAYAEVSDFFYVWLKRTLGDLYPLNFTTPQNPKTEECTALKHQHGGSKEKANQHFENKLLTIFDAIEYQTSDLVSIMFAHQSTEAWITLCNSILGARMNIMSSWAVDTELTSALKANKAFLSSSVTVACRPSQKMGIGEYKEIKKAIEKTVKQEVDDLYLLGFRGADLLTACFGPAVSEFGKFKLVEKADGTEVTIVELLDMAREAAFNAIVSDTDTDDYTKFYIGWLNLFGFTDAEYDDVRRISQIGLNIDLKELVNAKILIQDGKKQSIASFEERVNGSKKFGESENSYMIDRLHRAMQLYKGANRGALVQYIGDHANTLEHPFWRVLTSLSEVLPSGVEDHKSAVGLMTNKESLIRESLEALKSRSSQGTLFGE